MQSYQQILDCFIILVITDLGWFCNYYCKHPSYTISSLAILKMATTGAKCDAVVVIKKGVLNRE